MANALYGLARQAFLDGNLDWSAHDIKAVLVRSSTYTPSIDTHDFLTDVTAGGAVVATSANFGGKSSTLGVANAGPITFSSVPAGAAIQYLIICRDSGVAATSELIAFIDDAIGLPVTPNGGDITVTWSSGAEKIFKL